MSVLACVAHGRAFQARLGASRGRTSSLSPRCASRSLQWFITVFTYNFHFEFSTRVWDCFLNEGWKVAFRVGLALLKSSQRE